MAIGPIRRVFAVVLFTVVVAVPTAQALVVGVDAEGNYWDANPDTAVGTLIGSTGITGLGSLAADDSNTLYTADSTALYTLDFTTGAASLVTPLTLGNDSIDIQAMAFGPGGVLYAANVNGPGANSDLWTVDVSTGIGTYVGPTDLLITAMDMRGDTMFAYGLSNTPVLGGPGLGTLDMTEAAFADLDAKIGPNNVHGISFKAPLIPGATLRCCELFAAGTNLFGMDPVSGAVFDIGPIDANGTTLVGIEGFFAVPEPTSAFAVVLAFGWLLSATRRR